MSVISNAWVIDLMAAPPQVVAHIDGSGTSFAKAIRVMRDAFNEPHYILVTEIDAGFDTVGDLVNWLLLAGADDIADVIRMAADSDGRYRFAADQPLRRRTRVIQADPPRDPGKKTR